MRWNRNSQAVKFERRCTRYAKRGPNEETLGFAEHEPLLMRSRKDSTRGEHSARNHMRHLALHSLRQIVHELLDLDRRNAVHMLEDAI